MTDLEMAAITREHWTSPKGYQPPDEVLTAQKALHDLVFRKEYGATFSRDEKRLQARYERIIQDHRAGLVAKHFPTAPESTNGANR